MKVSLINPSPFDYCSDDANKKVLISASWPPLGILYLATILKENGIEVSIFDQPAKGSTLKETIKWIEKENPNILGFSTISSSGITASKISHKVKKRNPDITVVFGGHYASFNDYRVLKKYPFVDVVVRGEGEETFLELTNNKDDIKRVKGITYRENDKIKRTPERPPLNNLNNLPFPDRSLLDVEYQSMIAGAKLASKKFTSILSSRGCVHRCRFCSCQRFVEHVWRARSVENVLDELQYLISEGYEQFVFVDDSFTLNQKRVINLCKMIRREGLDIEWFCEGRVDNSSYEMMRELSRAGCKVIFLGIESANQRILDYYNKNITPKQSETAVETARKAGIDMIVGAFILGAPDETREEMQNTLNFAKRLPIDFPRYNVLSATPGTEIWNELVMKKILNEEDYWETGVTISKIFPKAVPFHDIQRMINNAYLNYFSRLSFVTKQVFRLLKSSFRRELLLNNLIRINDIREEYSVLQRLD